MVWPWMTPPRVLQTHLDFGENVQIIICIKFVLYCEHKNHNYLICLCFQCLDAVTKAFRQIDTMVSAGQFDQLQTDFKSCKPLSMRYVNKNNCSNITLQVQSVINLCIPRGGIIADLLVMVFVFSFLSIHNLANIFWRFLNTAYIFDMCTLLAEKFQVISRVDIVTLTLCPLMCQNRQAVPQIQPIMPLLQCLVQ